MLVSLQPSAKLRAYCKMDLSDANYEWLEHAKEQTLGTTQDTNVFFGILI